MYKRHQIEMNYMYRINTIFVTVTCYDNRVSDYTVDIDGGWKAESRG